MQWLLCRSLRGFALTVPVTRRHFSLLMPQSTTGKGAGKRWTDFLKGMFMGQLRTLAPGQAPKAVFELGGEKPVAVYAYCNLHGLWMAKL